jgi:hypothetical protein
MDKPFAAKREHVLTLPKTFGAAPVTGAGKESSVHKLFVMFISLIIFLIIH